MGLIREGQDLGQVSLLDDQLEGEGGQAGGPGRGSSLLDDSGSVGPGLQGLADIAVATVVASQVHVGVDVLILVVGLGRGNSLEGGAEEPQGGGPQLAPRASTNASSVVRYQRKTPKSPP